MGAKNKGGREVRKPKQDKKLKGAATSSAAIPSTIKHAGEHPSK